MGKKIKKIVLGITPFLIILLFWYGYHYRRPELSWLIPSPMETGGMFLKFVGDGTFANLLAISLLNLLPPFLLAMLTALALGTLMGISRTADRIFQPFLAAINFVPSLAWLPLIILFLGFSRSAIWLVIFISCFMKMIFSVRGGIKHVDINYVLLAKNIGFGKIETIFRVILPCALPHLIVGLRLGFGSAWRSLVGAEMLVVTLGGLGKFIWMAQWYFDFDKVMAGIVLIGLISILVEQLVLGRLEKNILQKWGFNREYAGGSD